MTRKFFVGQHATVAEESSVLGGQTVRVLTTVYYVDTDKLWVRPKNGGPPVLVSEKLLETREDEGSKRDANPAPPTTEALTGPEWEEGRVREGIAKALSAAHPRIKQLRDIAADVQVAAYTRRIG